MEQNDQVKREGFRIDDYFISFPSDKDFITEDENGMMSILVDIYQIDKDNNLTKITDNFVTPELETKIQAFINNVLLEAIEEEERKKNVKDQSS